MSRSNHKNGDIDSREDFEDAMTALIEDAQRGDVRIEGTYAAWTNNASNYRIEIVRDEIEEQNTINSPNRERKPIDMGSVDITSQASLIQTLTGLPLDSEIGRPTCRECGRTLYDGDTITVQAKKPIEGLCWDLHWNFCEECSPYKIKNPRFGRTDVLVEATVADAMDGSRQESNPIVIDVQIHDYSRPGDGVV